MNDTGTVDTWTGRVVALWPGDTTVREAEVISVDAHGWEFEITNGKDNNKPGYRPGDRLYVSHSMRLTMTDIGESA